MSNRDYLCYLIYMFADYMFINFLRMIHDRYTHPFNVITRLVSVSE